ncbi:hypothetical protein CRG98_039561 [Punica granatum]|uniref:Uncharacterized protein n=1 Tax=Punica granatum TaxID=22663 RepID=A0A2I0I8R2_PUNGR|nr:hypothetical protein CRG98_039561 [Punica granatum]
MKWWLCTVDRPSYHDHLFTRDGEGCEEPLECDGTTRQSHGAKWHVVRARLRADFECLNEEDMRHVNECSGDSALRGQCSLDVSRCSGIVMISTFRGRAPKAHRETFVTIKTFLKRPSRVSEGHRKLVPRPWWSLGACRPVSGCRLLVSGSGLPEPCRKRRR